MTSNSFRKIVIAGACVALMGVVACSKKPAEAASDAAAAASDAASDAAAAASDAAVAASAAASDAAAEAPASSAAPAQ